MNGPIGKQMVDTLVESQSNVEVYESLKSHKYKFIFIFHYVRVLRLLVIMLSFM